MADKKRSKTGENHRSEQLYDQPAGRIAHKARFGASENSKQPNENGDLPDEPGGDVRT
ncbi:hypothetical protein LOK74_12935 [Brevibacillus humidisoli]|uniref:hypothetical protein n=1 Tax=Brevibacillus humidisoli TaxID=2895522 RepID=UPI001E2C11D3|nr:hypothetical protein [Brevibacillus humidisoli]UFJ38987.1 hypothetical protein LOK74_12935 [Brevibacillus humidisoli]